MDSVKMIEVLSSAFGASGFEDDVVGAARGFVPQGYTARRDSLLNFYIERERKAGLPLLLVEAHSDELGLMVQAIRPNGTLAVAPLGGWAHCALPAQRMRIKNLEGKFITGIVATKPPHLAGGGKSVPDISELSVDVGACSAEEVARVYKIDVGCPMVPCTQFEHHPEQDIIIGKAFDCRLGCAAVLDVLKAVSNMALEVDVVGTLSSQEEVGARGAAVASKQLLPDAVICFEGSPADDTFAEPVLSQSALKKGPMLRHMDQGAITNPRFLRVAIDAAARAEIPYQQAVRTGGFTNASAYQALGIPTLVISCPVRYIHSHNAIAALSDYTNAVALAVSILETLNYDVISSF